MGREHGDNTFEGDKRAVENQREEAESFVVSLLCEEGFLKKKRGKFLGFKEKVKEG